MSAPTIGMRASAKTASILRALSGVEVETGAGVEEKVVLLAWNVSRRAWAPTAS